MRIFILILITAGVCSAQHIVRKTEITLQTPVPWAVGMVACGDDSVLFMSETGHYFGTTDAGATWFHDSLPLPSRDYCKYYSLSGGSNGNVVTVVRYAGPNNSGDADSTHAWLYGSVDFGRTWSLILDLPDERAGVYAMGPHSSMILQTQQMISRIDIGTRQRSVVNMKVGRWVHWDQNNTIWSDFDGGRDRDRRKYLFRSVDEGVTYDTVLDGESIDRDASVTLEWILPDNGRLYTRIVSYFPVISHIAVDLETGRQCSVDLQDSTLNASCAQGVDYLAIDDIPESDVVIRAARNCGDLIVSYDKGCTWQTSPTLRLGDVGYATTNTKICIPTPRGGWIFTHIIDSTSRDSMALFRLDLDRTLTTVNEDAGIDDNDAELDTVQYFDLLGRRVDATTSGLIFLITQSKNGRVVCRTQWTR